jgi:hypothetical protein
MDHPWSSTRKLRSLRDDSQAVPHRAAVEFDRINDCWTYVCRSGNRIIERGPRFDSKRGATYGMIQRYNGTKVFVYRGES